MELVERDKELARLHDMLADSAVGNGAVGVVTGPVACGKTKLLRFFSDTAAGTAVLLRANGARSERALPAGILTQLFQGAPLSPGRSDTAVRLLDDLASEALLEDLGSEEAQQMQAQVMHGLCQILLDLAQDVPLVIVIDDVHFADVLSLRFLLFLLRRTSSARVLVVLGEAQYSQRFHPVFHSDLIRQPHSQRIRLQPFSRQGVADYASQYLGIPQNDLPEKLCGEYHAASGGNPLLLRALLDDYRAAHDGEPAGIPTELTAGSEYEYAVLSCLHRSDPAMLAVARGVALLTESTQAESIAALLGIGGDDMTNALKALTSFGLLDQGRYRTTTARAAVLNDIPREQAEALHKAAAEILHREGATSIAIAGHLVEAGSTDSPWVPGVLQEAAGQALLEDRVDLAIKVLELSLDTCTTQEDRVQVTVRLAQAEWRLDPSIAGRHLPVLLDALREGRIPDWDADWVIRYLLWNGYVSEAVRELERLSSDQDLPVSSATANMRLAHLWRSHSTPSLPDRMQQVLANTSPKGPALPAGAPGPQLQGASALSVVLTRGGSGVDIVEAAEAVLQSSPLDDASLARIVPALLALVYADRVDRAAPWCESLLAEAGNRGAPTWQAELANIQSEIEFRSGNLRAAEHWARAALTHISARSWGAAIGAPLAGSVLALTAMGRFSEAAERLRQPIPDSAFQTLFGLRYLHARGEYNLACGMSHAAIEDFLRCGDLLREWGIDLPGFIPWRSSAAEACLQTGREDYARQLVVDQLDRPGDKQSRTRGLALHVRARAESTRGRPAALRKVVDIFYEGGDRYQQARVLADLSEAQRDLGEHARSRMTARLAWQIATECGAQPLLDRTTLSSSVKDKDAGWSETEEPEGKGQSLLSDAEQRVAALACLGHTNREIAGKLYIAVSTVEQHLTRVYRKLNVSSRADLPTALRNLGVSATDTEDASTAAL
jgi:DNA-binding CsgD family transcriptional regulator